MTADSLSQPMVKHILNAIEAAGDAILICDGGGNVVYLNPAASALYGCTPRELTQAGGPAALFVDPDVSDQIHEALRTHCAWQGEVWVRACGGDERLVQFRVNCIGPDGDAETGGIICVATDITRLHHALEALRESEVRYRGLVESQQDLIVRVDREGRFTFVNDAYCEKFGKTREELLGKSFKPLVHKDDLAHTLEAMKGLEVPPYRIQVEQRAYTVQGERWIAWEDFAIRDETTGEIVEIQAIGHDITEHKEAIAAERAQRALAESLREIAAALSSTLNLDTVLEMILQNVGRVVPHDAANVMLLHDDQVRIVRAQGYAERSTDRSTVMGLHFALDDVPLLRQLASTGRPLLIRDVLAEPQWVFFEASRWLRSYIAVPIRYDDQVLGFLNLDSAAPAFFNEKHVERLITFADHAAIAIHNATLYERAQTLAVLEERQRIARELHDVLSQTLFSARVIAEAVPRLLARDPDQAVKELNYLHQLIYRAMMETRTLLYELRPSVLHDADLQDLLGQLADVIVGNSDTKLQIDLASVPDLPPDVQVAFYRIAQEALNNIIKHSRAASVTVSLLNEPDGLELRITDDGRGFDPSASNPGHMGLGIMRERATSIGADLHIESEPGYGTRVIVRWQDKRGNTGG
ncbi:MAG: hypothetical protein Kow00124_15350 [Anaerolineae bacterium]